MSEKIRLGFIASIDTRPAMRRYSELFPDMGFDAYFFEWRDLEDNAKVRKAYHANSGTYVDDLDLNKGVDMVVTRQMGPLHDDKEAFFRFLDRLEAFDGIKVNEPAVMRANTDKAYLTELEDAGIPVIPTRLLDGDARLEDILDLSFPVSTEDGLILKPRHLGESGKGLVKVNGQPTKRVVDYTGSTDPVIVQPYMEEILGGEASLFFFGDRYSHGVLKTPKAGEFRINHSFSPTLQPYAPSPEELRVAHSVIDHFGDYDAITRVDLVGPRTNPMVMEAERINPASYTMTMSHLTDFVAGNMASFLKDVYARRS